MHDPNKKVNSISNRIYNSTLRLFCEHLKTLSGPLDESDIMEMIAKLNIPVNPSDFLGFAKKSLAILAESTTWGKINWGERQEIAAWNSSQFPDVIAKRAEEIATLQGIEPQAFAFAALAVCSGATDHRFALQMHVNSDDWKESPRIWFLLIASASYSKTPTLNKALSPLKKIENEQAKKNQDLRQKYNEIKSAWERDKTNDKGPMPLPSLYKRAMCDDATIEALSEILKDNPQGILIEKDEMSGFFASLDKSTGGTSNPQKRDWIQGYDGYSRSIDRIMRGSIFCENWSFAICGATQYDSMKRNFKVMPEDGTIARFIPFCAGEAKISQDVVLDKKITADYADLIKTLHGLNGGAWEAFRLSARGAYVFQGFQSEIFAMRKTPGFDSAIISHLGKLGGLFGRLCCLYHLIRAASSGESPQKIVDDSIVEQVYQLMKFQIIPHITHLYVSCLQDSTNGNQSNRVIAFLKQHVENTGLFSIEHRDVARLCRAYKNASPSEREDVKADLVVRNLIRLPFKSQWSINPELKI